MIRPIAFACLSALAILSGCGADGPPTRPDPAQPQPGITITGEIGVGIEGGHTDIDYSN